MSSSRSYYLQNRDKILAQRAQYYEENKEMINERSKKYYKKYYEREKEHRWTLFCYNWSENRKMGVFSSVMTDSYD